MGLTVRKQILLDPTDARLIEERAELRGMSFAEYARAALLHFEDQAKPEEEEMLMALANELSESFQAITQRLDALMAQMDETHAKVEEFTREHI